MIDAPAAPPSHVTGDGIGFAPNAEQRLAVDSFRRFLSSEFAAFVTDAGDRLVTRDALAHWLGACSAFGMCGGKVRPDHGGDGLDWLSFGLLFEELAAVSMDFAGAAFIQSMAANLIDAIAPEPLRRAYLPDLITARRIASIGISEPGAGSNIAEIACRAELCSGGYRLTGEKIWITNGGHADLNLCLARVGPAANDLDLFLVERADGFSAREIATLGWRATSTAQLTFDQAWVPEARRLTHGSQGLRTFTTLFAAARPLVGLASVGVARAALDRAIGYAQTRIQHGKPIAAHQLIQAKIANMAVEVDAARLLCWRALAIIDAGGRGEVEAAMAKYFATEAGVRVTSDAVQIHGSNGIAVDTGIERLFRNARMATMPEGTTELQQLIIGRGLTGVRAF